MNEAPLAVLLVEDHPGDARLLEDNLREEAGDAVHITWVQEMSAVEEILETRMIDAVILDLNLPDSGGFDTFKRMRSLAPELPVLVLTGLEDDQLGLRAIQEGAQDYLVKNEATGGKVARSLRYAVERHRSRAREVRKLRVAARGKVVGFAGVKGGVGTTTVLLNTAALLARNTQRSVTAVEVTPGFGSFAPHLHESPVHSLATLQRFDLRSVSESVVEKCLVRSRFGFDVLFSPQKSREFASLSPDSARQIVDRLARRSVYTFVDLPGVLDPVSAAVLPCCDLLVLTTERDPCSVAAARRVLRFLRDRTVQSPRLGLVVVNRSLMIDGFSPAQLRDTLECDLLGVVPPAPEVSVSAQRSGTPLALHRPLSAPARALTAITEKIARAVSEPAPLAVAAQPLSA